MTDTPQTPTLTIAGHTFKLTAKAPGGLVLKIAEAEAAGDVAKAMVLIVRALRAVIDPDDTARFEAFYESAEFDRLDLEEVAEAVMTAVAGLADGRPTPRPGPSPSGSPATPATSRVVSLSRATPPESSTAGRSAAS